MEQLGCRHRCPRIRAGMCATCTGFTLAEIALVVSIMGIMLAMVAPSLHTALIDARASGAMRAAQGHLRAARDSAMSMRRVVEVQFLGTNQIASTRLEGVTRQPLMTTVFEYGMVFRVTAGVPDTPDALGSARAVDFGGVTTAFFQPDGSLGDATGLPISGTVFLGVPSRTLSARAITVLGPTGRVQAYRWDGRGWR
jgi:type II secretory pathway pseudopilin PulG